MTRPRAKAVPLRVLVTGGRGYTDAARVREVLDAINEDNGVSQVIHGACGDWEETGRPDKMRGADRLAHEWAESRRVSVHPVAVPHMEWDLYGGQAGPMRNGRMIRQYHPDLVVAFPGGRGTKDCVHQAEAYGVRVVRVDW